MRNFKATMKSEYTTVATLDIKDILAADLNALDILKLIDSWLSSFIVFRHSGLRVKKTGDIFDVHYNGRNYTLTYNGNGVLLLQKKKQVPVITEIKDK